MNRIEDMIQETKLYEVLKRRDEEKCKKTLIWILAIVGAVAAIAGIAYAVYRFMKPDYLEDYEDDIDDEFDYDDDFFDDDDEFEFEDEEDVEEDTVE